MHVCDARFRVKVKTTTTTRNRLFLFFLQLFPSPQNVIPNRAREEEFVTAVTRNKDVEIKKRTRYPCSIFMLPVLKGTVWKCHCVASCELRHKALSAVFHIHRLKDTNDCLGSYWLTPRRHGTFGSLVLPAPDGHGFVGIWSLDLTISGNQQVNLLYFLTALGSGLFIRDINHCGSVMVLYE